MYGIITIISLADARFKVLIVNNNSIKLSCKGGAIF